MANETIERERLQEELRKSEEISRALLNAPTDRALLLDPDGRIPALNEALRESEERFRTLAEYSPFGLSIMRPDRTFEYFNPKFQEIFGYGLEDIPDKERWFELAYPDPNYREAVIRTWQEDSGRIIEAGRVSSRMFTVRCRDGQDKVIFFRNVALKDGKQLMTYEDVTARTRTEKALQESEKRYRKLYEESKQAEAQLLQAHKMEAIGTLAGGVAHDFNNILQAISGYTQMLMFHKAPDDPELEKLEAIFKATERAGELTRRLLIFGRKLESRLRPVSLNQEMEQVLKLLQWTIPKMIRIEAEAAPDLRVINADPVQLEQVMMNLAVNARDAMPEGGRLIFQTADIRLDEAFCKSHMGARPGDYVLLSVSDTGHGMSEAVQQHIFEPFFTTKGIRQGTGLGLAMVYGIVKSHGGFISWETEVNRGTTFRIYFPVLQELTRPAHAAAKAAEGIFRGTETILLVDDEPNILDIGQKFLGYAGYTVAVAENGEQALDGVRRQRPDLVILDLNMPGMGGYRCLEELHKISPGLKVIVASGYSSPDEIRKASSAGASSFVEKPYELNGMLRKVREVLDGR